MRTESFHADDLARLLRRNKIATMSELKKALGTQVEVTVFRKLKQLSYRSSYSHRSRYYTLDEIARFDPRGLWSFQSVRFSRSAAGELRPSRPARDRCRYQEEGTDRRLPTPAMIQVKSAL